MESLVEILVARFEKAFPDYASYSPLIFNAVRQRAEKFEAIFAFYREYREKSKNHAHLVELCERTFRAAILDEVGKNSDRSKTALRMFMILNRASVSAFIQEAIESDEVSGLVTNYPFLTNIMTDYLNELK